MGGKDGGGTRLTDFGRRLVADYRAFEASVDALAADAFADMQTSGKAPEVERGRAPGGARACRDARARARDQNQNET